MAHAVAVTRQRQLTPAAGVEETLARDGPRSSRHASVERSILPQKSPGYLIENMWTTQSMGRIHMRSTEILPVGPEDTRSPDLASARRCQGTPLNMGRHQHAKI